MSRRSEHEDRLLAETFEADWDTGRTAGVALAAAARARRRRGLRRSLVAAGTLAALVLAGFLLRRPVPAPPDAPPAVASVIPREKPAPRGYEVISDAELLAELRDRPLLIVTQTDGSRRVVVLERTSVAETLE